MRKPIRLVLALTFVLCSVALAQQPAASPQTETKPQASESAKPANQEAYPNREQRPPTIIETPKAGHPVTALKQAKKIYLEPMVNDLDQYLKAEFSKQLSSRVVIVLKPEEADAVMTGTGEWHKGTGAAVTGRLLGLHDTATGAVSLVSGDTVLWASEAGDRSIWWGVLKRGGQRKVADRIVNNFKHALDQAR